MSGGFGLVVKAEGGLFTVKLGEERVLCKPRGKLRLDGAYPLAGDRVAISDAEGGTGHIEEIAPRKNSFVRPPVANVDRLLIVASEAPPVTPPLMTDFLTVLALYKGVEPVVLFNKADLESAEASAAEYKKIGFETICFSALTGQGAEELRAAAKSGVSVLTGNSGVGKTSILNALFPGLSARTGEISANIGRGRQTTRHTELLPLGSGYIADTPGYSTLSAIEMEITEKADIARCFPEFESHITGCRYGDCAHIKDDGCALKAALAAGEISPSRYESYVYIYESVKDVKQWQINPRGK